MNQWRGGRGGTVRGLQNVFNRGGSGASALLQIQTGTCPTEDASGSRHIVSGANSKPGIDVAILADLALLCSLHAHGCQKPRVLESNVPRQST